MTHYDVVIAGGGPAGASAATVLAGAGLSVLVLDKAVFPRDKLCAGLLTWKTCRTIERVFGVTPRELKRLGVINNTSDAYRIRHRARILIEGPLVYPFHFVARRDFDAWCLDRARAAGAEVLTGAEVAWADPRAGQVRTRDGREFSGTHLLAADGALSTVRRFCAIDPASWRAEQGMGLEIYLERDWLRGRTGLCPDLLADFPTVYSGFVHAGYGWSFPHRDRVIIGICGLHRALREGEFRTALADFLDFLGIPPDHGLPVRGHPLPYGNWLRRPHDGRTLLVGDAGGMVEPFFGEGIHYALHTGELAARAVLEARTGADPRARYEALLADTVFTELEWSRKLRRLLFWMFSHGAVMPVAGLLRGGGNALQEMVHGIRSFKLLRRLHDFDPRRGE